MPYLLLHHFPEAEHAVHILSNIFSIRIVRIGMMAVEKLHDMEAAAIHVEVDVALLEIRSHRLPDLCLRMQPLDLALCGISDALTVRFR